LEAWQVYIPDKEAESEENLRRVEKGSRVEISMLFVHGSSLLSRFPSLNHENSMGKSPCETPQTSRVIIFSLRPSWNVNGSILGGTTIIIVSGPDVITHVSGRSKKAEADKMKETNERISVVQVHT
jgi:hypothetical protein